MAIKNIDNDSYADLYQGIDQNILILLFQKIKLRTIFPLLKLAKRDHSIIDIGCARGAFLGRLQKYGYTNLTGLDLKNQLYKNLDGSISFIEASITDDQLLPKHSYDFVTVQAMLHHLPVSDLAKTAKNLSLLVKPGGYLMIYEPNMASVIGHLFYFYFLRLFPRLYVSTLEEKPEQLQFCAAWPDFVECLKKNGIQIQNHSNYSFYKTLIGVKN